MFLIDDLLLSPFKGFLWIFKEIHEAAKQEVANEGEDVRIALTELYLRLDTGQISEEEFTAEEAILLDRLEAIEEETEEPESGDESDGAEDMP